MLLLVAFVFIAHFFDYSTFTVMVGAHGIDAEANPVVSWLYTNGGMPVVTLFKVGGVAFATGIAVYLWSIHKALLAGWVFGVGIITGTIATYTNLLTI